MVKRVALIFSGWPFVSPLTLKPQVRIWKNLWRVKTEPPRFCLDSSCAGFSLLLFSQRNQSASLGNSFEGLPLSWRASPKEWRVLCSYLVSGYSVYFSKDWRKPLRTVCLHKAFFCHISSNLYLLSSSGLVCIWNHTVSKWQTRSRT